jgi:hypothetical protein
MHASKAYSLFSTMFGSSLPPVVCKRAHVLFTLFVFVCVYWCPTHIMLCVCFVFLRLVYPMLPVSLCCVMFVFVLCTLCCLFPCVVLCLSSSCVPYVACFSVLCYVFLRLVYPMLPFSLDCPFLIAFRYSLTFI